MQNVNQRGKEQFSREVIISAAAAAEATETSLSLSLLDRASAFQTLSMLFAPKAVSKYLRQLQSTGSAAAAARTPDRGRWAMVRVRGCVSPTGVIPRGWHRGTLSFGGSEGVIKPMTPTPPLPSFVDILQGHKSIIRLLKVDPTQRTGQLDKGHAPRAFSKS